jgi:hypothetical protein
MRNVERGRERGKGKREKEENVKRRNCGQKIIKF